MASAKTPDPRLCLKKGRKMGETLTPRERVWKAINFEEADRVPIDIGGTKVSGICVDEYVELVRYLGIDSPPPKVYEQFQMLARVEEPVRSLLHADVIELENPVETWGLANTDWKPWTTGVGNSVLMPGEFAPVEDERGYLYLYAPDGRPLAYRPPGGLYFERVCDTAMSAETVRMDPEEWQRSIPLYTNEELNDLRERARILHEGTEYSIHGGFLKGGLGSNGIFAGHTIGDWLCELACEREYAYSILQATAERAVENMRLYLEAVGDYIDTILISGTDFGTQCGELFNPEIFRDLYVPNYKMMNDYVHAHSHAKTMFHSCGSNYNLLEYFIEAGVDIFNPVQTSAARMSPRELNERYGGRLVFWGGGAETQSTLLRGSPQEVAEQVRERLSVFGPGGGYVFNSGHNLQYGVPPENIMAMINAVLEFGSYPLVVS